MWHSVLFKKIAPTVPSSALCRQRISLRKLRSRRPPHVIYCSKPEPTNDLSTAKAEESIESIEGNGSTVAHKDCEPIMSYPTENEVDDGGFFPVREPGDFPSAEVSKLREEEMVEKVEFDPLRDGPLRYLGYANELGEAFAAWLPPGGVPFSYAVAVAYVLVDTRDKGIKAFQQSGEELGDPEQYTDQDINIGRLRRLLASERAIDTVVWQLLASVIIPGFTIHKVVELVHYLIASGLHFDSPSLMAPAVVASLSTMASAFSSNTDTVATLVEKSVPTFCGLAMIPFIVHPIDETVHAILNVSMRPSLRKFLCENGQGYDAGLKICDEKCMETDFPILSDDTNLIEAFSKSFEESN